ncbi:hypothetical protein EV421DRAFT_517155 [Armillaria borealis]|uniref:F-box domain-containing protein n=1 Tax=Armillaria borealis TaxID=47425 RepID=A0AA39MDH6_9AGAR|nr:hypothetical protein EV421DRAFT_517155 [Armillaria borealis]
MASPTTFPSDWHPCKGCACVNHAIPSYRFSVTDADVPLTDHPDLRKLPRSNDAPTPPEEKTLRGMISDSGKRIDAVDAHVLELKALRQALVQSIARVDKELAALDKERQRLSDSTKERQSILSALRRMPKEVLAHIFFHTLVFPVPQVKPSYGLWSSATASRHPLLSFELVSRNWKDVLDTFPNLWSYVNIPVDRMYSLTYAHYIGNQLSRSRLCPLSVSICHSNILYTRPGAFPSFMLVTLFSVSCRIQTLHLCLPGKHFADMQQFHLSFPTLQELVLLSSYDTSEVAQHLHFGSLPNLRVFHATDISNVDELSLPWHQITHFTNIHEVAGRGLSAPRAQSILKMMSRVSTTLSKLHSLTLSSVYRQGLGFQPVIPPVLNSLILPALLDLSVTRLLGGTSQDQDTTFTSVRQLIERSHSPLTSLYFGNGEILKDDLIHILSSTPTLQDLRLTQTRGITDEVLNHLARRVDTESGSQVPALIPHLHTLHLSSYLDFQVEVYVQMVESRWTCHPRHLKSVHLSNKYWKANGGVGEAAILALSRLAALRSEGLDVVTSTSK